MNKPTHLKVDFDLILHRNYFGGLYMDLPYSEELVGALKVIEVAVQKKRDYEEALVKTEFLAKKFRELKANISDFGKCKELLYEISNYHKAK